MTLPHIAALVLAAGRSTRMGGPNKLLATFDGVPLIRRSVETALASRAVRVIVVTGHQDDRLRAALEGLDVEIATNPAYAQGLSTSLRMGFPLAAREADGVMVMLADQPNLRPAHLDMLIDAWPAGRERSIVVASAGGVRGNPVILPSGMEEDIETITGDKGARDLIHLHKEMVREVEIGTAALLDVDTPDALRAAGGILAHGIGPKVGIDSSKA